MDGDVFGPREGTRLCVHVARMIVHNFRRPTTPRLCYLRPLALTWLNIARLKNIADIGFVLPDTAGITVAEVKMRQLDLRDRNRDLIVALLPNHFSLRNILAQVVLDLAANDFSKTRVALFYLQCHIYLNAITMCAEPDTPQRAPIPQLVSHLLLLWLRFLEGFL